MRRVMTHVLLLTAVMNVATPFGAAVAQVGGLGGTGGYGGQASRPGAGGPPPEETQSNLSNDKPDAAAGKAYKAGMKSLNKARDFEAAAANAINADKRNAALEKKNDAYGRALDQFTEALSNKGDMFEAWNNVGYIHLRLGAYAESIDDYNHTLALKPDLLEAIEHRAEAYVAVDRLDEAKVAYMNLFNHDRKLADQLMVPMQQWLLEHRSNARGMRLADVEAFDSWLKERDGIAKQTASLP